jgi:hypothetical protein
MLVIAHIVYTGKCVCESSKIAVWFMVSESNENLKKFLPANSVQIEALSFFIMV